ncbi:NUDIX hydrolase [Antrihabitans cavernicola]|uniref:NUDIX domain-containing protein n=1 Tax=Antrihabitans cavernicola TaxID=2495913 RepID=A0A5A7S3Z9_9NOCA|nr:NUDIX domain-containing protein [Spelaeibacter cavernicola]KAA0016072.1 NUDIX domain-containing protein [Spelaeibacter cavernicola]
MTETAVTRIDHYNDPDAPPANSVVPSTTAVVTDTEDRIVLIRRRDNDLWALPGGGMDLGESIVDTAVREVKEETGLDVEVTGLIGVYTNPHHVMAYTDGEVRQQFSLCFTTRLLGGTLLIDSESTDIAWTPQEQLDAISMHPSMRLRINHYREHRPTPYLG